MSEVTLETILAEIERSKIELTREFKSAIEASETRILLKFEDLRSRVTNLEKENLHLRSKIEYLERDRKKNNVVIFGLKLETDITLTSICRELSKLLDITLKENDVNDVFSLGHSNKCPIKVELISYQKKKEILNSAKKLKGKNIYITADLTQSQRETNRILKKHLIKIRQNSSNNCYIRGDKLYINYKPFTAEELEEDVQIDRPSSAPPTPTVHRNIEQGTQASTIIDRNDIDLKNTNKFTEFPPVTNQTPKEASKIQHKTVSKQVSSQALQRARTRSRNN